MSKKFAIRETRYEYFHKKYEKSSPQFQDATLFLYDFCDRLVVNYEAASKRLFCLRVSIPNQNHFTDILTADTAHVSLQAK